MNKILKIKTVSVQIFLVSHSLGSSFYDININISFFKKSN